MRVDYRSIIRRSPLLAKLGAVWLALSLLTSLATLASLAGCTKSNLPPAQVCSAQETYTNLTHIISHDLTGRALAMSNSRDAQSGLTDTLKRAFDSSHLASILAYNSPTLASYNKDNNAVTCNALLTVQGGADAIANLNKNSASLNSYDRNHLTYNIIYTVHPSTESDKGEMVYRLSKDQDLYDAILGIVGLQAVKESQPSQAASSAEAPSTDLDDADPPTRSAIRDKSGEGTWSELEPRGEAIGMRYGDVRTRLLSFGYSPVPRDSEGVCDYSPQCRYPEAENCAETGQASCEYRFVKAGSMLRIMAKGETDENEPGGQIVYSIAKKP